MKSSVAERSSAYQEPLQSPSTHHSSQRRAGLPHQLYWKFVPSEGWFAMVLLAISMACVVYSIVVANWVAHTAILFWSGAVGILAGLIISKIRWIPQLLLHISVCVAGYWLAVFLTSVVALHIPWTQLMASLKGMLTGDIAVALNANHEMNFLFYLSFLCFFLGYLGSWLVYHAHLPLLVVLAYCSILLINLNYSNTDHSHLILIFMGAQTLLVARLQLVNQLSLWSQNGLYTDKRWLVSITNRFMRFASLFVVLAMVLSLVMPIFHQSQNGVVFWDDLDSIWSNVSHGNFPLDNPQAFLQPYQPATTFFGDTLSITGSVNLPPGDVLSYKSSDKQPHYLEGFTYDYFDGHTWFSRATQNQVHMRPQEMLPQEIAGSFNRQVTTEVTVLNPPQGRNYIFGPGSPASFNVPTQISVAAPQALPVSWEQQGSLTLNEHYKVVSLIPTASPQALAITPLPSERPEVWQSDDNYMTVSSFYLQKPRLSPLVEKTMKQWVENTPDAYEAVKSLESHLSNSSSFTYSLRNDPVPASVDAATWLLQTRKGYCTYYATTMVMMAREMGLPARMVNGFSPGNFNERSGLWTLTGADAHSWVQVYFPNFGWVDFDPTPGYSAGQAANQQIGKSQPTPLAQNKPLPVKTPVTAKPKPQDLQGQGTSGQGIQSKSLSDSLGLVLMVLVLSGLLLAVGWLVAREWWRRLYPHATPISGLYWRICRVATLLGTAPSKSQTPYEYSHEMEKRFQHDARPFSYLTDLYVKERWSPAFRSLEEKQLALLWPRLRAMLFRLLWKRK